MNAHELAGDERVRGIMADLAAAVERRKQPQARYYVMVAGRPKLHGSRIVLAAALSPRAAHEMAATDYRRAEHLPSSVYVQTERVFDSESEEEGVAFIERLTEAMDAHSNSAPDEQAVADAADTYLPAPLDDLEVRE